jgi:predicted ATPase/DNA-binding winged helix-turn-helix (wHTH) protein
MTQDAAFQYSFGRFVVEPRERRLLVDGQPVTAGPRAFDVLLTLIERAGQLVTKDELFERVWPKLIVEENNLQVQVSALRKILGRDAIATIPGQGYRFTPVPKVMPQPSDVAVERKDNLPQLLTSFVGHENDLAEYTHILEQTRLLTLTGIGGCGKTRLAIELARMILPSFPDGVWFVDLAPVAEAERVAIAVATTLDVREDVNRSIHETLARHLASQHLLLVLDNCEHVVAACATLVERLLMAASGVRALITSREGLGIAGERIVPVRSLAFPPPGSARDPEAMATFEAVRLFVDRARQVASNFALNPLNAATIGEICRQLDGIPLALELAAARVKLLSVDQIRAKLDDRFRLLTGNARAMSRHQTLLATLQWSYDHLTPDQQQLLRRLSVFVDGWTLEGAVRVAGGQLDEYAVLDLLTRLVDQSLVIIHDVEDGTTRYSMLETVRQYAQDRLNEAGEAEATRKRHLDFYVALAEEAEPQLVGQEQSAWLALLDLERENLLAAHAWCDHAEELAEPGLRLVFSLWTYLRHRFLLALGHRITVQALGRPTAQGHTLARCRALWVAGEFSYFIGRYAEASGYAEMSLVIARERRDDGRAAEALRLSGRAALALGNRAMAQDRIQEALALSRQLGDKKQLSRALTALAFLLYAEGNLEEAELLCEESLALSRERGDRGSTAIDVLNLAWGLIRRGLGDQARGMVREGFAIADEIDSKITGVGFLGVAMHLAAYFGDWKLAAKFEGAFQSLSEHEGLHSEPANEAADASLIARTHEALGSTAFTAAESEGRTLAYHEAIAEAREWLEQRT